MSEFLGYYQKSQDEYLRELTKKNKESEESLHRERMALKAEHDQLAWDRFAAGMLGADMEGSPTCIAEFAALVADALMAEREKRRNGK